MDQISERENPKQFLANRIGKDVKVVLKWGIEYEGILGLVDKYFNIYLKNATEIVGSETTGMVGDILIRCNNIKTIQSKSK
ncbi:Small nuclear ribonucleoprotein F [Spraguea lophii 42_110]|uniref:Sm protein F n=1 Tax=Spraguea lophii (strain 42_110) TaxID=1358809 RepID=S7WAV6_SPRLO|nr:Small nuclear ribonucleoprotein F [Spraguea lophii 42_110]